ncbi:MAG: dihydrolipoyl dehydrogenase [Candidatus Eremiobacteraeota bacterium]|nr:dihydrolipoyl dehydrogenase [Candidatus Eremiobacteraeota bacterium]MBC5802484.1 dihydrolipoyl dehydrogenase [Candidatus Eremiobacteraeota bacterium]MBC5822553.1 dihydrolipoyl dehydrogenase [Candidatus Eremiobacteraeota bacterium]
MGGRVTARWRFSKLADTVVDAIVIGAGPGGYHAAIRLGQLGKNVVCMDRDEVGGVCLNWGCIPTKALLHVGEVSRHIREADKIGLKVAAPEVDREGVAAFTDSVVKANVGGVNTLFKANNVAFAYGEASFVEPKRVALKKRDGSTETYAAKEAVVIATGSAPVDVKAWPRDGETIINSDDAVRLKKIPKSLLVIGGGVIGLEFATVYTRLGAKVLVVEMMPQVLTGTDLEISKTMARILKKQGVEIALGTKVVSLEKTAGGIKAVLNGEFTSNKDESRDFEVALVAVGRRPVTDNLNLAGAGLQTDDKGFIAVDAQRRTPVEGIFAIGDVTGAPLLAHKAMKEGVVAAEVIGGDVSSAYDPIAVPNCVYTDPEVATVGLSEEEAKAAGYELRIGKFPLAASGRARTMNESDGLIKLVGDAKSDLLLGMHIVAPQAESLIGEGVIALEMGATLEDIGLSIHPHPTLTEALMDAAEAAHFKAIHVVNAKPKGGAAAAKAPVAAG